MGTTAKHALPYPELSDTPDVPRDVRALAVKVDAVLTENAPAPVRRWTGTGTTNANGDATVIIDPPLPFDPVGVVIQDEIDVIQPGTGGPIWFKWIRSTTDRSRVTFRAYGTTADGRQVIPLPNFSVNASGIVWGRPT